MFLVIPTRIKPDQHLDLVHELDQEHQSDADRRDQGRERQTHISNERAKIALSFGAIRSFLRKGRHTPLLIFVRAARIKDQEKQH